MIITVGLDISKEKIDYHYAGHSGEIANTEKAIVRFFRSLKDDIKLVVMESTGKYHRQAHRSLDQMGIPVRVINPYQSKHFANALNLFCKTDKVDAKMLWQFGEQMPHQTTPCPSELEEELLDLSRHLQDLKSLHHEVSQRKEMSSKVVKKSLSKVIDSIEKEMALIKETLNTLIKGNEVLKNKRAILTSIPGVGEITATMLLCHLKELGTTNKRQIAALSGLAPMNQESGKMKGKRRLRGGRREIKASLYMPILGAATQHNQRLIACYQRLIEAGKPKKVALVACMRKLIVWANALLASGQKWNDNFATF